MLDPDLGDVVEHGDELTCTVSVNEASVELTIRLEGAPLEDGLAMGRRLVPALAAKLDQAREVLVASFLSMVNDGYRNGGAPLVTRSEFLRRATISGVEMDTEGSVSFHCNDDDMLWGHWMTVEHATS